MSLLPRASGSWGRGSDAIGAALTFAVSVALFAWLGYLGDGALGSSPLLMIVGVLLGLVGGFLHVLRVLAPDLLPGGKSRAAGPEAGGDSPGAENDDRQPGPRSD
jgi:F0F1-type ATP synthase assembly protein I